MPTELHRESVVLDKAQLLVDHQHYSALLNQITNDRNAEIERLNYASSAT